MIDIGLYIGYGLFLITLVFAIVLPLIQALKSPKDLIGLGLIGMVLVGVYFISFLLSDSEVKNEYVAKGIDEVASGRIGSGLIMFYITLACAFLGIVFSEIKKILL